MKLFRPRVAGVAAGLLLAAPTKVTVDAASATASFTDAQCAEAPVAVMLTNAASCTASECTAVEGTSLYAKVSCPSNVAAELDTMFDSTAFLMMAFGGDKCVGNTQAIAYLADGECHEMAQGSFQASVGSDNTAQFDSFQATDCTGTATFTVPLTSANTNTGECVLSAGAFYTTSTTAAAAIAEFPSSTSDGSMLGVAKFFHSDTCAGAPTKVELEVTTECTASEVCSTVKIASGDIYQASDCLDASTDDPFDYLATAYGDTEYAVFELYEDAECSTLGAVSAMVSDGVCYSDEDAEDATARYASTTVGADGSITLGQFSASDCSGTATMTFTATAAQITAEACIEVGEIGMYAKVYKSAAASSSSTSTSGSATITAPTPTPTSALTPTPTSSAPASMKLSVSSAQIAAGLMALAGLAAVM